MHKASSRRGVLERRYLQRASCMRGGAESVSRWRASRSGSRSAARSSRAALNSGVARVRRRVPFILKRLAATAAFGAQAMLSHALTIVANELEKHLTDTYGAGAVTPQVRLGNI